MVSSCCEFLPWDSGFFGVRIARLKNNRLCPDCLEAAFDWCRQERVACLYLLAETGDPQTIRLAEESGFRLMDHRITLGRNPAAQTTPAGAASIRPSRESDIPALAAIARQSHHDTRFYFDPRFPQARCDDLYAEWIEKSCTGWAQVVLVASVDGQAAGYCACHVTAAQTGSIGLLAVAPDCRGRGIGSQLVRSALTYFHSSQISRVTVVTQGRNGAAQRLYRSSGFMIDGVANWYHKWFD